MIVARLMGGLGNQMFQYAAARRLARVRETEVTLDLGWFRDEAAAVTSPRSFALERFGLDTQRIALSPDQVQRLERRDAVRLGLRRRRLDVIRQADGDMAVDERVFDAPDDVMLVGYWQSERYFADIAPTIRRDFATPEPREPLVDGHSVAVHVRRADYVTHPRIAAIHGALPMDYYRAGLSLLAERLGAIRVFVFSDDPEWARAQDFTEAPTEIVSTPGADAFDELMVMRRCRHHVIANSSFSWWGAWLGDSPDKIVVAPRAWFREEALWSHEIIPSTWISI